MIKNAAIKKTSGALNNERCKVARLQTTTTTITTLLRRLRREKCRVSVLTYLVEHLDVFLLLEEISGRNTLGYTPNLISAPGASRINLVCTILTSQGASITWRLLITLTWNEKTLD